jgi:flagellar assembly protein FliH
MKRCETLYLSEPLRDVRRLVGAPTEEWPELLRQREQAAREQGRREGEKALGEQLAQQRAELGELQRGILESLRRAVPQVVQETEGAVIGLALEAAQKVVAGLPITAEMVEGVVREALRQVEESAAVTVQLHPEDLALLRKQGAAVLEGVPETGPLRFVASAEVTRGGCLVQTRFGVIDARREVKFKQLAQSLGV